MSEPGESNGWASPDPGTPAGPGGPADPGTPAWPDRQEPPAAPPHGYAGGLPYWPETPQRPSGRERPHDSYGQPQSPYGQAPDPYGQWYGAYAAHPVAKPGPLLMPKGRPYHQMARNEAHRWWRPLVGSVALVAAGLGLAIGLMVVGTIVRVLVTGEAPDPSGSADESIFGDETADLAFNLVSIAVFLPVALLTARLVQRRRPGTLSSVAGRLRWRWMLVCSGLAVLFCAVSYGTSLLAALAMGEESGGDESWVGWGRFLLPALVVVLVVPFQAAAEEYVFRGWLLQGVGACTLENLRSGRLFKAVFRSPWPGILLGSVLFMSMHGYTGWGMLDIFVFGVITAWLAVRTGGLEASIALHVFNNLMAFLFSAAVGELSIEQGAVPWQLVVADIASMALFAAVVVWAARRMRVRTATAGGTDGGADDGEVTAAPEPAPLS